MKEFSNKRTDHGVLSEESADKWLNAFSYGGKKRKIHI
jgi:hypothetical protein